jgi:hypothetical protein
MLIGPGVDGDGAGRGFAVETAHVAVRIVEAHEPVDLGHRGKRLVDRLLQVVPIGAGRGISTKVPSSGCVRRTLSEMSIRVQNSLHAFGHVHRGQRGAGNVVDVSAHFQRTAAGSCRRTARASSGFGPRRHRTLGVAGCRRGGCGHRRRTQRDHRRGRCSPANPSSHQAYPRGRCSACAPMRQAVRRKIRRRRERNPS